jgi:hypothetical protein
VPRGIWRRRRSVVSRLPLRDHATRVELARQPGTS